MNKKRFFYVYQKYKGKECKNGDQNPSTTQIQFNMHLTLTQLGGPLVCHLGLDLQDIWMLFSWPLCKGGKEEDLKTLVMNMIFMLNEFT